MILLPFDKFEIQSTKTKEDILQKLKLNTNLGTIFTFFGGGPCFFNGQVNETGFKIGKKIFGRNSFLPIIIGEIEETQYGCIVKIRMRMCLYTILFMGFWLSVAGSGIFYYIYSLITGTAVNGTHGSLFMFAIGYILMMAAYKIPAIECKNRLLEMI